MNGDGQLLDIHGWRTGEVDDGVALTTELSRWPGGRVLYDPRPGERRRLAFLRRAQLLPVDFGAGGDRPRWRTP